MSHHTKCCNPHCKNCVPKECDIPHCERCNPINWARNEYITENMGIAKCPVKDCNGMIISIHGYLGQCRNGHIIRTSGNGLKLVTEYPEGNPLHATTLEHINRGWLRHFHRENKPLH